MFDFHKIDKEDITVEELYNYLEQGIPLVLHNYKEDFDVYNVFFVEYNSLEEFIMEELEYENTQVLRQIEEYEFSNKSVKDIYEKEVMTANNVYLDLKKRTKDLLFDEESFRRWEERFLGL